MRLFAFFVAVALPISVAAAEVDGLRAVIDWSLNGSFGVESDP